METDFEYLGFCSEHRRIWCFFFFLIVNQVYVYIYIYLIHTHTHTHTQYITVVVNQWKGTLRDSNLILLQTPWFTCWTASVLDPEDNNHLAESTAHWAPYYGPCRPHGAHNGFLSDLLKYPCSSSTRPSLWKIRVRVRDDWGWEKKWNYSYQNGTYQFCND